MIKICTVYFEGKYKPEYVSKLYRGLKRNTTVDFQFICYSDTPNVDADIIIPLPKVTDIKLHWHKLSFFSPQFAYQNPDDEIIIMDIDQVIVNNIDDMLTWPVSDNELISYSKWWNDTYLSLNGGWYKFKSGSLKKIWNEFIVAPEDWQLEWYKKGVVHHKYYGEQNFVEWMTKKHKIKLTLMPKEWIGKYTNDDRTNRNLNLRYSELFNTDYMILDEPHENLKVIHFANPNTNIHSSSDKWIEKYWK